MIIDLTGRSALVTGSTACIGAAIAAGLAASGADVAVNGRDPGRTAETAARIGARTGAPGKVRAVAGDVGTAEGCAAILGMTKTAQLAVSRGMAESVPGSGVTINAVLPGPTMTEGLHAMLEGATGGPLESGDALAAAGRAFVAENRPTSLLGRPATPEQVANMVVYVASEQASATTGAVSLSEWTAGSSEPSPDPSPRSSRSDPGPPKRPGSDRDCPR